MSSNAEENESRSLNSNPLRKTLYLTPQQLDNLSLYKYSGVDRSFLSRPNLITLIGLCFMISAVTLTLIIPPSPFHYLYIAFCISTYLNMDAIDGKQARRTGTSSPLGELFDHGCDAINMMLMAVLIPFVFGIPLSSPQAIAMTLTGYTAFYASTWEEYHTGTLYLDYISGPVEGAWSIVLASFVTFLAGGSNLWDTKIVSSWALKDFVPVLFVLGAISTIATSMRHAHSAKVSYNQISKEWIIPLIYTSSCSLLASVTPVSLSKWFIFLTGFPACLRISSTIVAHITKSKLRAFSFYPIEYIPTVLIVLNTTSGIFTSAAYVSVVVFILTTIGCFLVYSSTMFFIITDICNHLKISCLTIKRK